MRAAKRTPGRRTGFRMFPEDFQYGTARSEICQCLQKDLPSLPSPLLTCFSVSLFVRCVSRSLSTIRQLHSLHALSVCKSSSSGPGTAGRIQAAGYKVPRQSRPCRNSLTESASGLEGGSPHRKAPFVLIRIKSGRKNSRAQSRKTASSGIFRFNVSYLTEHMTGRRMSRDIAYSGLSRESYDGCVTSISSEPEKERQGNHVRLPPDQGDTSSGRAGTQTHLCAFRMRTACRHETGTMP